VEHPTTSPRIPTTPPKVQRNFSRNLRAYAFHKAQSPHLVCELHFCPAVLVDCSLCSWRKRIRSIILATGVIALGHNTDNDCSKQKELAHLYLEPNKIYICTHNRFKFRNAIVYVPIDVRRAKALEKNC